MSENLGDVGSYPEGQAIAKHEGEIRFKELNDYLKRVIGSYRRRGRVDDTPLKFDLESAKVEDTPLPLCRLRRAERNHLVSLVSPLPDGRRAASRASRSARGARR